MATPTYAHTLWRPLPAQVPAYRVRPVPVAEVHKRVNPLAVIFMSFEQFLHSREERRPDTDAAGRANPSPSPNPNPNPSPQPDPNPQPDPSPNPNPNPDPGPNPNP